MSSTDVDPSACCSLRVGRGKQVEHRIATAARIGKNPVHQNVADAFALITVVHGDYMSKPTLQSKERSMPTGLPPHSITETRSGEECAPVAREM